MSTVIYLMLPNTLVWLSFVIMSYESVAVNGIVSCRV